MSPRPLVAAAVVSSAGIAAMVCASCTSPLGTGTSATASNTASTYTPVTGIEVDPHSLFFRQGCGTDPAQVYKYAVVVSSPSAPCSSGAPKIVAVGVYDCFADAVFLNLGQGTSLGLTQDFDVAVDGFDAPTYTAQAGAISGIVQDLTANACPSGQIDDRVTALAQGANFTTTCVGHQEPQVQSLVACDPLQSK